MIKNRLKNIILTTAMVVTPLMASETYSLIGIEGGYNSIDVERNEVGVSPESTKHNLGEIGLKVGAQSDDFRFFLSGRYSSNGDFDYITSYGAEIQYLVNFSQKMNFYLGAGAGRINMKFAPEGETSRTMSESYISGDLGVNIHLAQSIDLELGARMMSFSASNTIGTTQYNFDNLITGYGSLIYKFRMN